MHDEIYRSSQSHIVDFAFDEDVVAVFPDMIRDDPSRATKP